MDASLARAVLHEADRDRVAARIEALRRRHPRASREELAERLIRSTAVRCGAAGLAWSGPAAFFGSMPLGPDLGFQIAALNRMLLGLAVIDRSDASGKDRAAGLATGIAAGFAADFLRRGLVALLSRSLPRKPGVRAVAGGLVGAALGYGTALAVGSLARDVLGRRTGLLGTRRSW